MTSSNNSNQSSAQKLKEHRPKTKKRPSPDQPSQRTQARLNSALTAWVRLGVYNKCMTWHVGIRTIRGVGRVLAVFEHNFNDIFQA